MKHCDRNHYLKFTATKVKQDIMTTDDEGINSPSISPPTTNQSCTETSINGKEEQESPTASSRGIFATLTEAAGYIASTMRSPPPLSVDSSLEPPPVEEAADDPDAMEIEDETVSDDTETKHEEKTHVQERSNDPSSERAAVGEAVGMATSHEDKRAVEETAIIKDSMEIDSTTVIPSIEMIQEDNNGEDDEDDDDLIQEKMKKIQGTVDVLTERRLGESLDSALDALQQVNIIILSLCYCVQLHQYEYIIFC